MSYHYISKRLGIDRKILREWIEKEDSLKIISNKDKKFLCNKTSGFITNLSEDEELAVLSWVRENRDKNKPISIKSLLAYACSINKNLGLKKFNAQQKWVIDL